MHEARTPAGILGRSAAGEPRRTRGRGRGRRLRRGVHRRSVGIGRLHAAGLVGLVDAAAAAGHVGRAAVRTHADRVRDGGADARPPHRRPPHPGARRVRPAGGGGLVRPVVSQAAGSHSRIRRHHPAGVGPGGAGDQRRPALSAAVEEGAGNRSGQAAQADHPSAARRHPDHAGRRGAEERRAGRRDLRRLAADLLHAPDGRHLQRVARRGLRPTRRPSQPRGLRDLRDGQHRHHRRPRRRVRGHEALYRALHGRHGRRGHQLPRRRLPADGLRRRGRRRDQAVPQRPEGHGRRDHPGRGHRRRRDRRRRRLRA